MEKAKLQLAIPCSPFFFISFFLISFQCSEISAQTAKTTVVPVGVILDLSSETGTGCRTSILMALEDFYADDPHKDYSTRVNFTFWDSMGDPFEAATIATDLTGDSFGGYRMRNFTKNQLYVSLKGERKVEAIMGPQTSSETYTVASICNRTQVPLISFSTTSPTISAANLPILIRATLNYSSECLAIADLIKHFNWDHVVPIYEDSDNGASILQSLIRNLNIVGVGVSQITVIPSNATDSDIEDALKKMMGYNTRVFLVHVVSPQAVRIFQLADKLGMMSKGYVWIVTSSVGDILDTLQPAILSSMKGVVGLTTNQLEKERVMDFSARYKAGLLKDHNIKVENPTMYQLWAYDAAWAVAMAVEKAKISDPSFAVPPLNGSLGNLTNAILNTNFDKGLAGNFGLVDGQRQFSAYEILNVVDKGTRVIGSWTQKDRIYTELKKARWPGNLKEPPKSSTYSPMALKLGIPIKRPFEEFVRASNQSFEDCDGFSIRVFKAAADLLKYQLNYTFVPVNSTSGQYKDIMRDSTQLDGIVGDIVIPEDESEAYFTKQYMEGGVQMLVLIKQDTSSMNMWMFLRPFPLRLWLISIAFFVFTALAIWVTEHRVNSDFGAEDSFIKQIGVALYFAFSTACYAHDRSLQSNLSRFLLIVWLFVVFVLTASYQATLSAFLTVEKLRPAVNSLDELKQSGGFVGYQEGSNAVYDLLTIRFGFQERKIRSFQTADEYAVALRKGSANGGVSAIFDMVPYLTMFLNQSQYCSKYTIVGETYQSNGFGFGFGPYHSALLKDISGAISSSQVRDLKKEFFKSANIGCGIENTDDENKSQEVNFTSFGGLFIITGVVSGLMVIISLMRYVHKNKNYLKNTLGDNYITVRDRISALWKNFLSSESSDPPEGASPVEMQEIMKGT